MSFPLRVRLGGTISCRAWRRRERGRIAAAGPTRCSVARGFSSTSTPRTSRWSIAFGPVGAASPKRRSSSSKAGACWAGRRFRSPPSSSGPPPANASASSAARISSAAPCPVSGTDRCMFATASRPPSEVATRVSSSARRSGRRAKRWRSTASILAGARTKVMLEPPSPDLIRSGHRSAMAARSHGSSLREVSPRAPFARHAAPRGASQRGGASCSRAISQGRPSRKAENSLSREPRWSGPPSGGWSRPWNRFQVSALTTIPE